MKLVVIACLAGMAAGFASAQSCCSTASDCTDQLSTADIEYNSLYGKTLECDQDCPGLVNCNMFGICEQCRGCFETCEGAMLYMEETAAPADFITFCAEVGIADLSECDGDAVASAGGSGSGSSSSGAGYGSGAGSASSGNVSGSGAGSGSGTTSLSGSDGASASGLDSASGDVSLDSSASGAGSGTGAASVTGGGSTSASGLDSTLSATTSASQEASTGEAYGSGEGSGGASMSSGTVSASGSGNASRVAEIDGCDCGTAELEPSFAAYFCENQKSMYCDLECVEDPDPADALFPSLGGLWCQPEGWQGCRMCKFDCTDYEGDCVPCPAGLKDWCE